MICFGLDKRKKGPIELGNNEVGTENLSPASDVLKLIKSSTLLIGETKNSIKTK